VKLRGPKLRVDVKLLRLDFLGGHVKKSFKCVTSTLPLPVWEWNCILWWDRIVIAFYGWAGYFLPETYVEYRVVLLMQPLWPDTKSTRRTSGTRNADA
jgi:hypothetical protein